MRICESVAEAVGNTPLIRLARIEREEGLKCRLLAKLERSNPTGSVKDRAARQIVSEALAKGRIQRGGTLVEPTSGNTGIALASICAAEELHLVIFMPENMSRERILMMRALGAEVILTPKAEGMSGAVKGADEYVSSHPESALAGQFVNPANPRAHYLTTGPEIYDQTGGNVDILVAGVGTGGTISGTATYLRERIPNLLAVGIEPASSPVLTEGKKGPHKIQGIGAGFKPDTYDVEQVDEVITVTDEEAYEYTRLLARREGILAGISSGANICGAVRIGKRASSEGLTIVTFLPDGAERYLSVEGLYD